MDYSTKEKEKESEALDKEEFLKQIQKEVEISKAFTSERRTILRENLSKYVEQTVDDEKVPVNVAFAAINLDIAVDLMDTKTPIFSPRWVGDDEIAENLTDVAIFDQWEMGLKQLDFIKELDRRTLWVTILCKTGWDETSSNPIVAIKDPLCWLPDPSFDPITPARFHYFEEYIDRELMSEEYWFDEWVEEKLAIIGELQRQAQDARNKSSGYQQQQDDTLVSVINGYSYYENDLYMVTLDEWLSSILRCVKVKPVFKKEKEWRIPMTAVVNCSWWCPKRNDPFGVSMLEIIGPKQSAISKMLNLRITDATFSTLGQIFLYDVTTVKNAKNLATPSINPKYVWVDGSKWPISWAVYPVPRNNILEDSFRVTQEIQDALQKETGINNNQLWVQSSGSQTLWEIKQIQENANIRFGLTTYHREMADELFWKDIWYRSYKEFFSKTDKKLVRIASSIDGTRLLEFTKDDFLTFEDPDVKIDSRKRYEAERARMATQLEARLAVMEANPNTHEVSLNFIRRKILKLQWMTRAEIQVMVPYEPDEMDARNIVKLLSENDMQAATIRDINQDHMTYLVVFQSAMDTEAKQVAIEMRKNAYIQSGQGQAKDIWGWAANTATNQMLNASIQQNTQGQPTI